ncbi:abortive infection family protein [Mesorhizobium sp. M0046]|uniref:abortive infection family protein n=1 Tax=Mesorhizobium sp. M0046 TaxID=2956858 RepID=UPI00333C2188
MSRESKPQYSSALIKQLRHEAASAIADFSANDVPALCNRLGLGDGDREESFKSKYKYAERRLLKKSRADLLPVARRLFEESESYGLSEALARIEEVNATTISELTRRRILAVFDKRPLSTEMQEIEFLRRVWPTTKMPSASYGAGSGKSFDDDLFNALVRNNDWDNRDIFDAAGLLSCSQHQFFRFLEEVSSPLAQSPEAQSEIVGVINDHLRHDGYRLTAIRKLSGSPVYQVQPAALGSPSDDGISQALEAFDPGTVHARWTQALDRRDTDPEGAITLARTLLEDVCKWIIVESGETFGEKDDLPLIYRKLAKILNLAPDGHTEPVFKQILGSGQSVVESLGSLRNKIGDAHSPGPKRVKPAARHAQLAVNLSGTMATFLVSTWEVRKPNLTKEAAT